ncbi:glycine betaine L-proline ABC transporter ATP-binding protein [Holzapfeliella floricola DSM 23037 = JCM 16512]|uniref:Quaternary amine transport ATP-binding protein n=2 Tax=Holzapfeliella TaxID=2767883 RepID=A0A0R2DKS5_9LACO|nr:glycine betaine L-proline ABC transporter ATP-binding protein [Holzapfeliella floricola DSM 23037 = JCM 16512]
MEVTMPVVEVKNLTKVFGRKTKAALEMVKDKKSKNEILRKTGSTVGVYDASFKVEKGEIFVIMGLSGSGKSTLIRLINRLIEPTDGSVMVDGDDIAKVDKDKLREIRRTKMSMVFQNFGLFPNRTILENTAYGLEIRGVEKEERNKRAGEALKNLHLYDFKDQLPSQLSGGMQQRVGLARALANDPEVLLMDEAFSALDPLIRKEMQDELLELQQKLQKTIIFITHDLNEALRLGDRITIMRDGQIQQIGTGEEILTTPANDYVKTFVQDVDYSRVLTAQNIMEPASLLNIQAEGPNIALRRMKHDKISMLLAVDRERKLQGVITAEAARDAKNTGKDLVDYLDTSIPTIAKDTTVNDIFNIIYDAKTPVAVTENGKVLGVVIRGSVIEALADEDAESIDTNDIVDVQPEKGDK